MKRLPVTPQEAESAVRTMALLMEASWDIFQQASAPRRSAAALERARLRREQGQLAKPSRKDRGE